MVAEILRPNESTITLSARSLLYTRYDRALIWLARWLFILDFLFARLVNGRCDARLDLERNFRCIQLVWSLCFDACRLTVADIAQVRQLLEIIRVERSLYQFCVLHFEAEKISRSLSSGGRVLRQPLSP